MWVASSVLSLPVQCVSWLCGCCVNNGQEGLLLRCLAVRQPSTQGQRWGAPGYGQKYKCRRPAVKQCGCGLRRRDDDGRDWVGDKGTGTHRGGKRLRGGGDGGGEDGRDDRVMRCDGPSGVARRTREDDAPT